MKQNMIWFLLIVIIAFSFLGGCSQSGVSTGNNHCSSKGEVCVNLTTIQTFSMGAPVPIKIIVTSPQDISDLHVSLYGGYGISINGIQTWESYVSNPSIDQGDAYWDFAIKAGQTLTFARILTFPSHEGYFTINLWVTNTNRSIAAVDSFYVHVLPSGNAMVNRAGTPFPPYTPMITVAAYGPGTPVPPILRPTLNPSMATPLPGGNTPMPLVATSTGQTTPYPPPPTSTPFVTATTTPTLHPYP